MAVDGDNHLRKQLEGLRAAHFEQLVDEQAMAFTQQEVREQGATSTERAIIDEAKVLRDRIIDVQAKHLRRHAAMKLGRWLMSRRTIPEIRFGFAEDHSFGWDTGDMTVTTAPLLAAEEETADGKVSYGWVFELESPIPEVMAWCGGHKDPPIHAWGRYDRSSIDIYRVAEDQNTHLQSKEKWFNIDPDANDISCWKLAEQRGDLFDTLDHEPIPEEDRRIVRYFDKENGQVELEFRTLSRESEEREQQRLRRFSERLREHYAPDPETSLQLLGIIRGSLRELA